MNTDNMNIQDIIEEINDTIRDYTNTDQVIEVRAEDLGLSSQSGNRVYIDVDTQAIMVPSNRSGGFEYYSGFSYVESDQKSTVGDWVIYHNPRNGKGSERVEQAVDFYYQTRDEEETDDSVTEQQVLDVMDEMENE